MLVSSESIPERARRVVVLRSCGRCEECHRAVALELHHLRYLDGLDSIRGRETPSDLEALCRDCHKRRHIDPAGDWWNDPEEMENHWAGYWNEISKE